MSNIEKIRQEIERRITDNTFGAKLELIDLLSFIDSLPDENNPEPYNPVYDEDYLNEKIAKATKSWEGVDVNKMLADCRGYEEKPSDDLEEAAKNIYKVPFGTRAEDFIAGAEWMRKKDVEDMYMSDNRHFLKCYEQGKVDMKVAMMKDAWNQSGLSIRLDQSLEKLGYGEDTEVKVIIVKQNDKPRD